MKNNFKKFAAVVLALVMCVSTLVPVFAADATCPGKGNLHTVDNCEATVTNTVEGNCGVEGQTTYKCNTCEDTFFVKVPATGNHDYLVNRTEPTCQGGGSNGSIVQTCKVCGYSPDPTVLLAPDHEWVYTWKDSNKNVPCNKDRWTKKTCALCGDVENADNTTDGDPAYGHKFSLVPTSVVPSTCKTPGTATYTCTVPGCGATTTSELPLLTDHVAPTTASAVKTHATCTTNSVKYYNCEICGVFEFEEDDAGHLNVVSVYDANAGTVCGQPKYQTNDKKCTTCGVIFNDANGNDVEDAGERINVAEQRTVGCNWTYAQVGHVEATCTTPATLKQICTRCGATNEKEGTAETATELSNDKLGAKLGHDWEDTKTTITNATCTVKGRKATLCSRCDVEKDGSSEDIEKLVHSVTVNAYYLNADGTEGDAIAGATYNLETGKVDYTGVTCGAKYYEEYHCANCDGLDSIRTNLTFANHDFSKTDAANIQELTPASCTTKGTFVVKCNLCGKFESKTAGQVVDSADDENAKVRESNAKGHSYHTVKDYYDAYKAEGQPNVTKDGGVITMIYEDVIVGAYSSACDATVKVKQKCTVCHVLKSETAVVLPAMGHKYIVDVTDSAKVDKYFEHGPSYDSYDDTVTLVNGTGDCFEASDYVIDCEYCGSTGAVHVKPNDGTGAGHKEKVTTAALAPKCNAIGKTKGWECDNPWCDYSVASEDIPTLHSSKDVMDKHSAVPSSCLAAGTKEYYTCKNGTACINYKSATGLPTIWVDGGVVDVPAANAIVDAQDAHVYTTKEVTQERSCTALGYTAVVCDNCDITINTTDFELTSGHTYKQENGSDVIEYHHSCEDGHYSFKTCTVCGYADTTVIKGPGHYNVTDKTDKDTYVELTTKCNDAPADRRCDFCDALIRRESHVWSEYELVEGNDTHYCTTCGFEETRDHVHAWGEAEVVAEATHLVEGSKVSTCTVCGETKTETIAKLAAHEYGDWIEDDHAKHFRVCDCGHEQLARHAWDEGVVTTEPAVGVEGVKTFTCADCLATKTESIAALPAPETDAPETDDPETDAPETDAPETDDPETDAPETDAPETDAPETDAPETDAPETDAPETDAPATDAPATDAPETEAPADKKGCKGSIAAIGVALVATLGTCAVFAGKKKED